MSYFLVLRDSGEVKYTLSKNEGYQTSCLKDDSHTEASETCNYSLVWFATPNPEPVPSLTQLPLTIHRLSFPLWSPPVLTVGPAHHMPQTLV